MAEFFDSTAFLATIDQVLDDCEQYSTEIVDKAIYRVHQEINHITQRHLDALHLFMFSKFYLIRELSNIQVFLQFISVKIFGFKEKWEKMNNVAERFNEQTNKEKMWQNFNASCRNLRYDLIAYHLRNNYFLIFSDFQLIVEQLKNEIRKGLQQGLAAYAAEYVGTKASNLFDAKKIQNKIKIDLLKGTVFIY